MSETSHIACVRLWSPSQNSFGKFVPSQSTVQGLLHPIRLFQALELVLRRTYIFLIFTLGSALPQLPLPHPPFSSFPSHIAPPHFDKFPSHISQSLFPSPVPNSVPHLLHSSLPSSFASLPLTPSPLPCSRVHTNRVAWPYFALTTTKKWL